MVYSALTRHLHLQLLSICPMAVADRAQLRYEALAKVTVPSYEEARAAVATSPEAGGELSANFNRLLRRILESGDGQTLELLPRLAGEGCAKD